VLPAILIAGGLIGGLAFARWIPARYAIALGVGYIVGAALIMAWSYSNSDRGWEGISARGAAVIVGALAAVGVVPGIVMGAMLRRTRQSQRRV
jgi:hypothetical protein